jgi:hypothetical protein
MLIAYKNISDTALYLNFVVHLQQRVTISLTLLWKLEIVHLQHSLPPGEDSQTYQI